VTMNDCVSKICSGGACVAANCTDGVLNGTESDVDCGGTDCKKCIVGGVCRTGVDCDTGVCTAGRCVAASCTDGVKNQAETDVDCGGSTTCPRCTDYKSCNMPSDCATNACTQNYCGTTGCQTFGSAGGYVGCQRTMPVAQLPCEDIRTTGTRSTVTDDSYLSGLALPFPFTFFGTSYSTFLLSASGAISFNTTNPYITNYCLPYSTYGSMIAVFWEHIHTSPTGAGVWTQTIGTTPNRRFVIQWYAQLYNGSTTLIDVRAVLKEGRGDIDVCYVNTTSGSASYDTGLSETAGIQNGTTALQFSCNTATLVNGLLLQYKAP